MEITKTVRTKEKSRERGDETTGESRSGNIGVCNESYLALSSLANSYAQVYFKQAWPVHALNPACLSHK